MRVLVLGAAGSAADNYTKCIRDAHYVLGADVNEALLPLSCADETVVMETLPADGADHASEIGEVVRRFGIDVIHAAPDQETLFLAEHGRSLGARTFVPSADVVRLCQDKLACARALGELAPESDSYPGKEWLNGLRMGDLAWSWKRNDYWLRATGGAGSLGAIHLTLDDATIAKDWVAMWQRRSPGIEFMLSEYLPGPDRSWTAVYRDGELVARGMRERVQYMGSARSATGQTSTYQVGRLIHDDALDALCREAVARVDPHPHGWYYVDTKGHEDGTQRVTEVNVRPNTTLNAWAEAGLNLPLIALDCAHPVGDYADGVYLRQPDMGFRFIPDKARVAC